MSSLFLALLTSALVTIAGREAVRVGRLSAALGQAWALLAAAWSASLVLAGAAWVGARVAVHLHPDGRLMMVAFALVLGGLELLVLRPTPQPEEPTRSFGAITLVLAAAQVTGAASLLVFALAGLGGVPWLAGAGGVLGAGVALSAAWAAGPQWDARPGLQRAARQIVGGALIVAGCWAGIMARGIA